MCSWACLSNIHAAMCFSVVGRRTSTVQSAVVTVSMSLANYSMVLVGATDATDATDTTATTDSLCVQGRQC